MKNDNVINVYVHLAATDEVNGILQKLCTLTHIGEKIMSAISDFATKQNEFNDKMETAITDIAADIKSLNDMINTLQTSPGTITPEDQATLDALQEKSKNLTDKLTDLDDLTPPKVPTA